MMAGSEVPLGNAIAGLAYKLESTGDMVMLLWLIYYSEQFGWWKWPFGVLLFCAAVSETMQGRRLFKGEALQ